MSNVIGRFYLKLSTNGNLLGEYSNNCSPDICPEAAQRIGEPGDYHSDTISRFVGTYHSVWNEGAHEHHTANLTITLDPNRANIVKLVWTGPGTPRVPLFEGQAMLCDDILIGNYETAPSRDHAASTSSR